MIKPTITMDASIKVRPISEGYVVKGGVNTTSRITTRPPAPEAMKPVASATTSSSKPKD